MRERRESIFEYALSYELVEQARIIVHAMGYYANKRDEPPRVRKFLRAITGELEKEENHEDIHTHLQKLQLFFKYFVLHGKGKNFISRTAGPYLDDIHSLFLMDHDVGLQCGHMVLKLAEGGYDCRPYLDAVRVLAEGSNFGGRVRREGKLASLLDTGNEQSIEPSLKSEVFRHWLYADTSKPLPPYSWGGAAMMHALKTGTRRKSYDNELEMAGELGREDAAGRLAKYTHGYPDLYIDLGSGDGGKGVARTRHVLEAGRDVIYLAVDYNKDAIGESVRHATDVFSGIADRFGKRNKPQFEVIGVCDRIENLPENRQFLYFTGKHPIWVPMWYGTTAANYDPPQSVEMLYSIMPDGRYAEVGLQLDSGDYDGIIDAFGSDNARAVSAAGLRLLGFSDSQIESMDYNAKMERMGHRELRHLGIGKLSGITTFFTAARPMTVGLVSLTAGDHINATQRWMYTDGQFHNVYTHGGRFNILDRRQTGDDAMYQILKP